MDYKIGLKTENKIFFEVEKILLAKNIITGFI